MYYLNVQTLYGTVATASVTITTTPTLGVGIILCDKESVTLTCHTDQSGANFAWQWSYHLVQADSITVLATLIKTLYACVVSDSNGHDIGKANITILANGKFWLGLCLYTVYLNAAGYHTGSAPHIVRDHFHHYISEIEGHNLTLTTFVTSDLPLISGYPFCNWGVLGGQSLPPTAEVDNYTDDGILHCRLSLYNLSYFDDSGNYTNTASNKCGTSFIFVFIQITKGKIARCIVFNCLHQYPVAPIVCDHPAIVTKPLQGLVITVEGEYLLPSCSFRGNYDLLKPSLTSYWKIDFHPPDDEKMYIFDNSSDLYRIALYQACLTSDGSCCNFISQLIILSASLSLSGASLTCTEGLSVAGKEDPVEHSSNTTISKLIGLFLHPIITFSFSSYGICIIKMPKYESTIINSYVLLYPLIKSSICQVFIIATHLWILLQQNFLY